MQVFSQIPQNYSKVQGRLIISAVFSIVHIKVLKPSDYLQGSWGCVVRGWGAVAQETERAALQSKDPWLLQSTY